MKEKLKAPGLVENNKRGLIFIRLKSTLIYTCTN